MITFVGGSKFAKGGPNPLANMDSRGSISASGFGPGGPYSLADLDRGSKSARTPGLHLIFSEIVHFLLSARIIFAEFNIHSQAGPLLS